MRPTYWTRRKILNAVKYLNENDGLDVHSNVKCDKGYSPNAVLNAARLNKKKFKFEDKNGKFIGKRELEILALGESSSIITNWTREDVLSEILYMHQNNIDFHVGSTEEYKTGYTPYKVYAIAVTKKKEFGFEDEHDRFIGKRGLELLAIGDSDAMLYGSRELILSEIRHMNKKRIRFDIKSTEEYKPGISPYKIYSKAMNNAKKFGFVDEFGVFIGKKRLVECAMGKNSVYGHLTTYRVLKEMRKVRGHFIGGRLVTPNLFIHNSIEEIAEIAKVDPEILQEKIDAHVQGKRVHA